jgi:ABC-type transport system involved in cytochrome bd biosynthesis fused ATPase/permease subunit
VTAATASAAARHGRGTLPVLDRRLFAESLPARRLLAGTVLFGLLAAGLVVAQAGVLTDLLVGASTGGTPGSLLPGLAALLVVVLARAALTGVAEVSALRSADAAKAGLRARLLVRALERGPAWLGGRRSGGS